jgi:hypothetical protein
MKIEIVKESKFGEEKSWYILYIDEVYIRGSHNLAVIEELYEDAKNYSGNPTETLRETLKSEEI